MENTQFEPSPEEIISGTYLNRSLNKLRAPDGKHIDNETNQRIHEFLGKLRKNRRENPKIVDTAIEDTAKQFEQYGITKQLITLWLDLPDLEQFDKEKNGEFVVSSTRADEIKSNIRDLLGIPDSFSVKLLADKKSHSALHPQQLQTEKMPLGPLMGAFIYVQILKGATPFCHIRYALNEKAVDIFDVNLKKEAESVPIADIAKTLEALRRK